MKALKSRDFLASVSTQSLQAGYLVTGTDGYMLDKVYQGIRTLVRKKLQPFETITLYGDELTLGEISEYLDSYSIFAENRLLVIRNAERLGEENKNRKNPDKAKQLLSSVANYLHNPEPTQVVVLIAEKVDGRISEWKKIREAAQTVECDAIKWGGEMTTWLTSALRLNQKTMDEKARELFLEKVELDFCTAENEIEKLFIYTEGRSNITVSDIHATLPTTRGGTKKDFNKAIGNRNTAAVTVKVIDQMSNDVADLQILNGLFRYFLTIWKIHALRAKHITKDEITAKHLPELFDNERKDFVAYAEKYKPAELPGIFATILETDARIKLSMADSETLMTMCVYNICHDRSKD